MKFASTIRHKTCNLQTQDFFHRMLRWAHVFQVLLSKGVEESKILLLTLIAAPEGIHTVCESFPSVKIVTSEIDEGIGEDYQVYPGMQLPGFTDFPLQLFLAVQNSFLPMNMGFISFERPHTAQSHKGNASIKHQTIMKINQMLKR